MKYKCENCGAFYSDEDVMEQYGDNAFRIEHIDDAYDDPYIAEVHECPCCGERQEVFMGLDDDAIEERHCEFKTFQRLADAMGYDCELILTKKEAGDE